MNGAQRYRIVGGMIGVDCSFLALTGLVIYSGTDKHEAVEPFIMASVAEQRWTGRLIYCTLFGGLIGVQVNIAKALIPTYEVSYILLIRSLSFLTALPFVEWDEADNYKGVDLVLYITIALLGFGTFGAMVFSLQYMGTGDSNAIEFGAGLILTGVIGHFLLNERISFPYFLMLLLNSAGVVLVAQPTVIFGACEGERCAAGTSREIGAVFALMGASFTSFRPILMRTLVSRHSLHCFITLTIHGLIGMVCAGVWCTLDSSWVVPETWLDVAILITYGLSSTIQLYFGIQIVLNAAAVDFAVATTISVAISYVAQVTFFGEEVDVVCVLGAVIVVSCFFLSAFWEQLREALRKPFGREEQAEAVPEDEMVSLVTDEE